MPVGQASNCPRNTRPMTMVVTGVVPILILRAPAAA